MSEGGRLRSVDVTFATSSSLRTAEYEFVIVDA
jgi:hypothetical protein